ncbi:MAG: alpha-ribazole phosphatase family protein [Mariprofundaceae bacterium]
MSEPVIIDLLRHGEVAAEGWAFRGSTDLPLSATGWRQMRGVSASFDAFDQIATSPLQRCRLFAEELDISNTANLITLSDMREMDFGAWENRSFDELEKEYGALLHQFWQSPVGVQPPGGEAFDAFSQRVIGCWENWIATDAGNHRLLVAHGGVIRILLAHLMDMSMSALWRLHLPYASWSRISLCEGHQPRLLFMNREPTCGG